MQTTSTLYKNILSNPLHWFEVAVTIGGSGVLIDENFDWIDFGALYLEGSLIDSKTAILVDSGSPQDGGVREDALISVKTSNQLFSGNTPSIGNAVAGQVDLQILDGGFSIPELAEIRPYVRATDGTQYSEWIPQGVYYLDTRYTTKTDGISILSITGYDAMLKADQPYPYDTQTKASTVVKNIASMMGLENQIDPNVWTIIPQNGGDVIQCSGEYTCREHLQYIAALYGGNWTITNIGKLNLVRINDVPYETNLLTDEAGYTINFGKASYNDTSNAQRILVG